MAWGQKTWIWSYFFPFFLQDDPRHSFTELVDANKATAECLSLCRAVAEEGKGDMADELERKLLVLSELMHKVHQQMAQNLYGKKNDLDGSVMFIVNVQWWIVQKHTYSFFSNEKNWIEMKNEKKMFFSNENIHQFLHGTLKFTYNKRK